MNEITFATTAELVAAIKRPGAVYVSTTILGGDDWMEVEVKKTDLLREVRRRDYPIFTRANQYDHGLFLEA